MASEALDRAESAARRIDEWKTQLVKLGTKSLAGIDETDFLGRELRAAAVVAAMAELESLLRAMLIAIGAHINDSGTAISSLVPSLRPLAANDSFERLLSVSKKNKSWESRLSVTQLDVSNDSTRFPGPTSNGPQPPLDGSTIQPHHLALIWNVLGVSSITHSARVIASLKKCTQMRNDVAHRNVSIHEAFQAPGVTAMDVANYLSDLSILAQDIGLTWDSYITTCAYIKS